MIRLTAPGLLLAISLIAGCSSASGPMFNAYSIDTADGAKTYRVECQGLFEGADTCKRTAEHICGDRPVQLIEKIDQLGARDPRAMTFRCEAPVNPDPAPQPAVSTVPMATSVPPRRLDLSGDANFDIGRATLTAAATSSLDSLVASSKDITFKNVTINGYTDSTGSRTLNEKLSKDRADSVLRYLKNRGLRSDDYIARGEGSANPIASNKTAIGRAQNRRVEIRLTQ